jgi:hypothetical protein
VSDRRKNSVKNGGRNRIVYQHHVRGGCFHLVLDVVNADV